ncbi:CRISPR-associated protein, Csm2 family [Thermovibrio ammonificans HB-1]|uniref:CRISPR system Cms protein Csm2 n=1 Tax=Thermovibrio ammonificans (strain DSM 15698 / JCM 12110 / HB-1) TaxID=648996 RepID=E8T6Q4_THEA1|nr:type III-A CRISPR-associated protein Csm2 [Thermovibrio ammonificans]ADU96838.1 CRISPR-associated protein, Csm2 family [Thermovibrio ammonificans HB-1]
MSRENRRSPEKKEISVEFVKTFIKLDIKTKEGAQKARRIIQEELQSFAKALRESNRNMKFTQIRKHYNYLLTIYRETERKGENYFYTQGQLKLGMGKVFAIYDEARKNITREFKEFLVKLFTNIETPEELGRGKVLFEALVGYCKGLFTD